MYVFRWFRLFYRRIDLLEDSTSSILLVSHYGGGKGTKSYQDDIFKAVKNKYELDDRDQVQSYVVARNGKEDTTRTRSFMFFSHAIVYGSAFGRKLSYISLKMVTSH